MNKLALVVVLGGLAAGCKKKEAPQAAPPPPAVDAAPAIDALEIDAGPPPLTPAIPAGKVGVQILGLPYEGIETPGLPAIRDDGSQIAVTVTADDGGRGYLDLDLRLLDGKTGKVARTWRLADPDEINQASEQADTEELPAAFLDGVRAKVAEANAALAAVAWRPLATVKRPTDDDVEAPAPLVAGDYTFTYKTGKLTIARAGAAPIVKTFAQLTGIKSLKRANQDADDYCGPDQEYVASVAVDPAAKIALVEFDFMTGHNCGSNGQVHAVVALP